MASSKLRIALSIPYGCVELVVSTEIAMASSNCPEAARLLCITKSFPRAQKRES
jgi:hypothetical protein